MSLSWEKEKDKQTNQSYKALSDTLKSLTFFTNPIFGDVIRRDVIS